MGSDTNPPTSSFDTNMVIILAALLSALICALGLNSIVRCALRCGGRLLAAPADRERAPLGFRKSALRRIPVSAYTRGRLHTDCTICLAEFEDGQKVRVLPRCGHGFHVACIDPWLVSHSSCPTCRRSLLPEVASSSSSSTATTITTTTQSGGGDDGGGGGVGGDQAVINVDEVA